jgi:hypothetical protein
MFSFPVDDAAGRVLLARQLFSVKLGFESLQVIIFVPLKLCIEQGFREGRFDICGSFTILRYIVRSLLMMFVFTVLYLHDL